MARLNNLESLASDPWYKRLAKRLSNGDWALMRNFVSDNDTLDIGDFELKVNRMFIDREKPKQWKVIMEFLTVANTMERRGRT